MDQQKTQQFGTVDEYIGLFEGQVQLILTKVRETIRRAAPEAVEKISWNMPTYVHGKNLIHFAAGKNHLGIYPGPDAIVVFADQLTEYKTSKGAIQFPYNKNIPYDLIAELTKYRVKIEQERMSTK